MKRMKKNKKLKICIFLFIITLIIIGIKQLVPKSKAEEVTVVGSNLGYGMITVTYNSNYVGENTVDRTRIQFTVNRFLRKFDFRLDAFLLHDSIE